MSEKPQKTKEKTTDILVFEHARVDPSHCLTDGLFRPQKKEKNTTNKSLDVSYKYKEYTLRWLNYTQLGIFDQSVFIAIHRLASDKGRAERVGRDHENPIMRDVREALKLEKDAASQDCLVLNTSLYEIAKTLGLSTGGSSLRLIKESLFKLSCVSFVIYKGENISGAFWKTNLFSELAGINGEIVVGINPTLSRALCGGQSTFINMEEQKQLGSDVSKRLHVWLSSWMRSGDTRKIERDILVPHVWGNVVTGDALRSRRHTLRKALAELNTLEGWSCTEDDEGNIHIHKPE